MSNNLISNITSSRVFSPHHRPIWKLHALTLLLSSARKNFNYALISICELEFVCMDKHHIRCSAMAESSSSSVVRASGWNSVSLGSSPRFKLELSDFCYSVLAYRNVCKQDQNGIKCNPLPTITACLQKHL